MNIQQHKKDNTTAHNIHYGVAEKGKLWALDGNYKEALRYYKEALRMCQTVPNADIFFQHYSLCAMEALELMGAYNEVIDFCNKCLDFLEAKAELTGNAMADKFKASLWERMGIQYVFIGEQEEALAAFKNAAQIFDKACLPISQEIMQWMVRGYRIQHNQIKNLQLKHGYFAVRKDSVNESIAVALPEMMNPY
jgi:tetratricopeptide (TPR) repeat protein